MLRHRCALLRPARVSRETRFRLRFRRKDLGFATSGLFGLRGAPFFLMAPFFAGGRGGATGAPGAAMLASVSWVSGCPRWRDRRDFYHLKKPKPSAIITSRDAYSQSEITETSVSVLLNGVNAGYRIVLSRSNPTPKRIREME